MLSFTCFYYCTYANMLSFTCFYYCTYANMLSFTCFYYYYTMLICYPLHACTIFQPVAGARIFRQLNNSMKRELTRLRREVGATRARREVGAVDSLDVMLRDMGYFTRRPFARLFGLLLCLRSCPRALGSSTFWTAFCRFEVA
jgi:hypothetical protein